MDAPTDSELVRRMAAGDDGALAALYDRYGSVAYGLALQILREPADAEEAVSDAFLQAWTSAASFDPGRSSVAAWLGVIARSRALDRLRARKRRQATAERAAAGDVAGFALPVAGPANAPDRDTEGADLRRSVAAALADLPPPQRRALELAYFAGLSQSEIARVLNEPLGTIKTRIRTGMEKLRAALAAYSGVA